MKKSQYCELLAILERECNGCRSCSDACELLAEMSNSPGELAQRGVGLYEAYSCFLCDRCSALCPLELRPSAVFAARRARAAEENEIDVEEYGYLLPDSSDNIMRLYRSYYGIEYRDLEPKESAATCFFPGCTLMTYSPLLTRRVYERLRAEAGCEGLIADCCGKLLNQMGLLARAEEASDGLAKKIKSLGVERLIAACPGCYYHLREIFGEKLEVVTIYEVLDFEANPSKERIICTIHDSCPDRFEGIFARQVRRLLKGCGYSVVEMESSGSEAPCCGSGGQVSHFRPELAERLVSNRLSEAEKTGADFLVAYCLSCVLNFAMRPSALKARHVLNLLLGCDEDYSQVKMRALRVFEEMSKN